MNTEIGRELLVSDLHPPVVVVTGKDKYPHLTATMWVREVRSDIVVLYSDLLRWTLLLKVNPDGTVQDNTGEQVHIWEYLGEV